MPRIDTKITAYPTLAIVVLEIIFYIKESLIKSTYADLIGASLSISKKPMKTYSRLRTL